VVGVTSVVRLPYPLVTCSDIGIPACQCWYFCWGGVCGNLSYLPVGIILSRGRRDDDGAKAKE